MEIGSREKKIGTILLIAIFLAVIFYIQVWMLPFSDYPYQDEYHSILRAIGKNTYPHTLHTKFLSLFTIFSRNFYDIFVMNFILSNFFLCTLFFFYHKKRGITLPANLFFTSALALSAINIALSRKMHFWGAAFFFLILILSDYFNGKKRSLFLVLAFSLLAFFRMEFAFSAALALGALVGWPKNRKNFFIFSFLFLIGSAVATWIIYQNVAGMKALVSVSLGGSSKENGIIHLLKLFGVNLYDYSSYVLYTFASTLKIYFFTFLNAFILLFFITKPLKENLKGLWENVKRDQLYYIVAMIPLLGLRNLDSYIVMFYVLFLGFMSFLLNSKDTKWRTPVIFLLVLPAFFIGRPDFFRDLHINFPSIRGYNGMVNRPMHDLIKGLPKGTYEDPYRILSYERIKEVLGREGLEFHLYHELKAACGEGSLNFDIVLIQESWIYDENKDMIEQCVAPSLGNMRAYPIAKGFWLYLSPRLQKEDLKF